MKMYKKLLILILLLFTFSSVVNAQGRLWVSKKDLKKELKKNFDLPIEIEVSDGIETIVQYSNNQNLVLLYSLTPKIEGSKKQWVQYSSIVPLTSSGYAEILVYLSEFHSVDPNTWINYYDDGGAVIIEKIVIEEAAYPIFIFEYEPADE